MKTTNVTVVEIVFFFKEGLIIYIRHKLNDCTGEMLVCGLSHYFFNHHEKF